MSKNDNEFKQEVFDCLLLTVQREQVYPKGKPNLGLQLECLVLSQTSKKLKTRNGNCRQLEHYQSSNLSREGKASTAHETLFPNYSDTQRHQQRTSNELANKQSAFRVVVFLE